MSTQWQVMYPGEEFALVIDKGDAKVYGDVLARLLDEGAIGFSERQLLKDLKHLLLHQRT